MRFILGRAREIIYLYSQSAKLHAFRCLFFIGVTVVSDYKTSSHSMYTIRQIKSRSRHCHHLFIQMFLLDNTVMAYETTNPRM